MLPYIAAGFGFGLLLYPWLSPAQGILSLSQEMARQFVLLGITLFIAANVKGTLALKRIPVWLPACIAALAALLVRSTVLAGLPFVPGDEDEYLFQARIFARGHVTAPAPPYAERFWAPGILIHGARWFGHHQPGHSLLLAAGVVLGIPGIIPAVSTGLTVLLLAMTARRLAGPDAGALTALLAMTSPMLLLTGATLVSETTSLLAVAAIFWLAVAEPGGRRRSLLLAGLMVGWLLNIRLLTGVSAGLAAWVLLGARVRFLLPGIGVGIAGMMAHNVLTTGSPFVLPFQLYEPNALGFRERFGPLHALFHLVRNGLLLNFWLLGWPVSFMLLGRGFRIDARLTRARCTFIAVLALANAYYWHPGQVATGPLRLHETAFFLLLFSGLAWHRTAQSGGLLARYVPIAMVAAGLGFTPVREAALARFIRTVHEPRRALEQLNVADGVIVLSGKGNLFHYPVNDPWLRARGRPGFMRDAKGLIESPFWDRPHYWLTAWCDSAGCAWSLSGMPPEAIR